MIKLTNQLYNNYPKTALDRLCKDSVSGDTFVEEGMTMITNCFLRFLGTWEATGKVNPSVLEAAADAHIWANIYFHLHILNRIQKKPCSFHLIQEFKTLYGLINEDLTIKDPSKRTLNQICVGQHLDQIIAMVQDLNNAERIGSLLPRKD